MPTLPRLLRPLLQTCALLLLWGAQATAHAQTVNWVTWTAPGSYPITKPAPNGYSYANGANGTLTLPDSTVVSVALTGEVIQFSCFAAAIAGCPAGWWRDTAGGWGGAATYPAGTFTSANVPTLPTNANLVAQAGFVPAVARHTLTFSQPVTNIVMTVASLGGAALTSAYQFDQDFTVLSQNTNCGRPLTDAVPQLNCLVVQGRTLTGKEGAGTLQFTGSFTSISWEVTVPEIYSGFNVGVTSASFTAQNPLTLAASPTIMPVGNTSTLSTTGGSGTGAISYALVSGPCTLAGNVLTGTGSGNCVVTTTKAGDGTFASLTSTAVTVIVGTSWPVNYDGNGATSGAAPPAQTKNVGVDLAVEANTGNLVRTGYTFAGWNTAADGSGTSHAPGSAYTTEGTATLYARWLLAAATTPAPIPTLSEWAQALMALLLMGLAGWRLRRR